MKATRHGKSRSHSWWWDSHNTRKNSKWLEENLREMDANVKSMLHLIEEDADSFAKRAEMYYQKRPELIRLVEEFYRAYRSLAERYDQLQGIVQKIPPEQLSQYGLSGDSSPSTPVSSTSSKYGKGTGFDSKSSHGISPKRSSASSDKSLSSSSSSPSGSNSDSDSESMSGKMKPAEVVQDDDLSGGLEVRIASLEQELRALQQHNLQLSGERTSAQSELLSLREETDKLKTENAELQLEVQKCSDQLIAGVGSTQQWKEEHQLLEVDLIKTKAALDLAVAQNTLGQDHRAEKEIDTLFTVLRRYMDNDQNESSDGSSRLTTNELDTPFRIGSSDEFSDSNEQRSLSYRPKFRTIRRLKDKTLTFFTDKSRTKEEEETSASLMQELQEQINSMEKQETIFKEDIEKHIMVNRELNEALSASESKIEGLLKQLAGITNTYDAAVSEMQSLQLTLSSLTQEKEALQLEILSQNTRVIEITDAMAGLEKKNSSVEADAHQKQQIITTLEGQLAGLKLEINTRVEEVQKMDERCKQLSMNLEDVQTKHEILEKEKEELLLSLLSAGEETAASKEKCASLVDELAKEHASRMSAEDSCAKSQAEIETLGLEASRIQELLRKVEEENQSLNAKLDEAVEQGRVSEMEINTLLNALQHFTYENQNGSDHNMIVERSLQFETRHTTVGHLKERMMSFLTDGLRIKEEADSHANLANQLQEQLVSLHKEIKSLQDALSDSHREKEEMSAQHEKEEKELNDTVSTTNVRVLELEEQIRAKKEECEEQGSTIEKLQNDIAKLLGDIQELGNAKEAQEAALRQEIQEFREGAASSEKRITDLEAEYLEISNTYNATISEVKSLQQTLSTATEEKEGLQIEIVSRNTRVSELTEAVAGLEKKHFSMEAETQQKQEMITILEGDIATLKMEISQQLEEVQKMDERCKQLSMNLEDVQTKHEILEKEKEELWLSLLSAGEEAAASKEKCASLVDELAKEHASRMSAEDSCAKSQAEIETLVLEAGRIQELLRKVEEENQSLNAKLEEAVEQGRVSEMEINTLLNALQHFTYENQNGSDHNMIVERSLQFETRHTTVGHLKERMMSFLTDGLRIKEEADSHANLANQLQEQLVSLHKEIKSLQDDLSDSHREKEEMSAQHEKEEKELNDTVSMTNVRVLELEEQIRAMKEECEEQGSTIEKLQNEITKLLCDIQELGNAKEAQEAALRQEIQEFREGAASSEKRINDLEAEYLEISNTYNATISEVKSLQQTLSTATEEKEGLQIEIVSRNTQVSELTEAVAVLEKKHLSMEAEMQQKQEMITILEGDIATLKLEISERVEEVQKMDERCKQLSMNLEDVQTKHEILEKENEEMLLSLLSAGEEAAASKEKCASLVDELAKEHASRMSAEDSCAKSQTEIETLVLEAGRMQELLRKLEEENQSLNAKLEEAVEQGRVSEMEINTLLNALQHFTYENQNGSDHNMIVERSLQFETRHTTVGHLKERMMSFLTDGLRIKQEADSHANLANQLQEQLVSLHKEIKSLQDDLSDSHREKEEMSAQHEKEEKELNDTVSMTNVRVLELEEQIRAKKEECDEQCSTIEKLQNEIAKLLCDVQELGNAKEAQEAALRQEIQEFREAAASSEKRINDLEAEYLEISNTHNATISEVKSLQQTLSTATEEKEGLQIEIVSRNTRVSELTEAVAGLEKKHFSMEAETQQKQEMITILEGDIATLKMEISQQLEEVQKMDERCKQLSMNLEDVQTKHESLEKEKEELLLSLLCAGEEATASKEKCASLVDELAKEHASRMCAEDCCAKSQAEIETLVLEAGRIQELLRKVEEENQSLNAKLEEAVEQGRVSEMEINTLLNALQHFTYENQNGSDHNMIVERSLQFETRHTTVGHLKERMMSFLTDGLRIKEEADSHANLAKQLQEQLVSLQKEIKSLQADLSDSHREKEEMSAQHEKEEKELNDTMSMTNVRVLELEEQIRAKKEECDEQCSTIEKLQNEIAKLLCDVQELGKAKEAQEAALGQEIQEFRLASASSEKRINYLEAEYLEISNTHNATISEVKSLQQTLSTATEEKEGLQIEIVSRNTRVLELTEVVAGLEKKHLSMEAEMQLKQEMITILEGDITALKLEISERLEEVQKMDERCKQLSMNLEDVQTKHEILEKEKEELLLSLLSAGEETAASKEKCASLVDELAKEHASRMSAEDSCAKSQAEIETLGLEASRIQELLRKVEEENQSLNAKLEEAVEQGRVSEMEINTLLNALQHFTYENQNGSDHNMIVERSLQFETRHTTVGHLKERMMSFLTDGLRIKEQADSHANLANLLQEQLVSLHKEIKSLQDDLSDSHREKEEMSAQHEKEEKELNDTVSTTNVRVLELEEQIRAKKEECEEQGSTIEKLQNDIAKLLGDIQELDNAKEAQEAALRQEIQEFREAASSSEKRINDLEAEYLEISNTHNATIFEVKSLQQTLSTAIEEKEGLQIEIVSRNTRVSELREAVAGLEKKHFSMEAETQQKQQMITILEGDIATLKLEISQKVEEVQKMDERCKQLSMNLEDVQTKHESLEKEKEELWLSLLSVGEEAEASKEKCASLVDELAKEHANRMSAEDSCAKSQAEIETLVLEAGRIQELLRKVEEENQSLNAKLDEAVEQGRVSEMEINTLLNALQHFTYENQNGSDHNMIVERSLQFETRHKTVGHLKERMMSFLTDGLRIKEQADSHANLANQLQEQLVSLHKEIKSLQDDLSDSHREKEEMSAQHEKEENELNDTVSMTNVRVLELEEQIRAKKEECEEQGSTIEKLQNEIAKLLCDIQELGNAKEALEGALRQEIQEFREAAASSEKRINDLEAEYLEISNTYNATISEVKSLQQTLSTATEEKEGLQIEIVSRNTQVSELTEAVAGLEKKHLSMEAEMQQKQEMITIMEGDIGALKLEISERVEEVLKMDERCKQLSMNVDDVQTKHEILEKEKEELLLSLLSAGEEAAASKEKCASLVDELAKEHASRMSAENSCAKSQTEIETLVLEAGRIQELLRKVEEENQSLNAKLEEAVEQGRVSEMEINTLLNALQHFTYENQNGSDHNMIVERSLQFETRHTTVGHLKERMMSFLTDGLRIKQEADSHANLANQLQEQLVSLHKEIKSLQDDLSDSHREKEEMSAQHEKEEKELNDTVSMTNVRVLELEEQIRAKKEECEGQGSTIEKLQNDIAKLLGDIQELGNAKEAQEAALRQEIQEFREAASSSEKRINDLEAEYLEISNTHNATIFEVKSLQQTLSTATEEKEGLQIEIVSRNTRVSELREALAGLEKKHFSMEAETQQKQEMITILEGDIATLKLEISQKLEEVQKMDERCKQLSMNLEDVQTKHEILEKEKEELWLSLLSAGEEAAASKEKCASLVDELAKEHASRMSAEDSCAKSQAEIETLVLEAGRIQELLCKLEEENKSLNAKLEEAVEQGRVSEMEINTLLNALQHFTYENQNGSDHNMIVERSLQFETRHTTVGHLKERMMSFLTDGLRIKQEADSHANLANQLQEQLVSLHKEIKSLQDDLSDSHREKEEMSAQHEKEEKELNDTVSMTNVRVLELEEQIRAKKEECEEQGSTIEKLQNDIAKLLGDIQELGNAKEAQEAALRQEIQELREAAASSEKRINDLEAEYFEISNTYNATISEVKSLQQTLSTATEEKEGLQIEIVSRNTRVSELTEAVAGLEKKHFSMEAETQQKQQMITILEGDIATLKMEISQQLEEVQKMDERCKQLSMNLEDVQTKHEILEKEKEELWLSLLSAGEEAAASKEKCASLVEKLAKEHASRMSAEDSCAKSQAEIETLVLEAGRIQELLRNVEEENLSLNAKLEEAVEQGRVSEMEINTLLNALQHFTYENQNGSDHNMIVERSLQFETRHTTVGHLKERMMSFLTDGLRIKEEADSHANLANQLQEQLVSLHKEIKSLQDDLSDSHREKEEMSAQHEKEEKELKDTVSMSNVRVLELEEQIRAMKEECEEQGSTIEKLQNEIAKLLCDIQELGNAKEAQETALRQEIQEFREGAASSEKRINDLEAEYLEISNTYNATISELKSLQQTLSTASEQKEGLQIEIVSRNTQVSELTEAVAVLEKNHLSMEAEMQQKQEMITILEGDIAALKLERSEGVEEVQKMDVRCKQLSMNVEDVQTKHESLEKEKEELLQSLFACRQELENSRVNCEILNNEVAKEHASRMSAENLLTKRDTEIENCGLEVGRMQDLLRKTEEENQSLNAKLDEAVEQARLSEMEINTLLNALQHFTYENQNGSDQSVIVARTLQFETRHTTVGHLKDRMMNFLADGLRIKEEADSNANLAKQLQEQSVSLHKEIKSLQDDLCAAQRDKDEMSALHQGEICELQEKLAFTNDRVLDLEEQITAKKEEFDEQSSTMEKLQNEIAKLLCDIEELGNAKEVQEAALRQEIKENGETVASSDERIKDLLAELTDISNRYTGAVTELESLQLTLSSLIEDKERLLEENESGKSRVSELAKTVAVLEEKLFTAEAEANQKQEMVTILEGELAALKVEMSRRVQEIQSLDKRCKHLSKNLEDMEVKQDGLERGKEELLQSLFTAQQETEVSNEKWNILNEEVAKEHSSRLRAEDSCTKSQAEIEKHVLEFSLLQDLLHKIEEENQSLKAMLEDAVEQSRVSEMEINTLLNALQHFTYENQNGSDQNLILARSLELETRHSTVGHLKDRMMTFLTDGLRIKEEADSHANLAKQLQEQLLSLHKEIKPLQDQLSNAQRDKDEMSSQYLREESELNEKLALANDRVVELESQISAKNEDWNVQNRSIEKLQNELAKLLSDSQELENAKQVEDASLRLEIQELREALASSDLKIKGFQAESIETSNRYNAAVSELEILQLTMSSLTEEKECLQIEIVSQNSHVSELKEKIDKLEDEVQRKRQALLILEEELDALKGENKDLNLALTSGNERMKFLTVEVSNLQDLHVSLQNELDHLSNDKQRCVDEYRLQLEKVEKELVSQTGRNSLLEAELKDASARILELEDTVRCLEKEKLVFSVEIASSSLLLGDLQRRCDGLQEEVGQLRTNLQSETEKLELKTREMEDLSSKLKEVQEERISLSMELEQTIHEYSVCEASLSSLQREQLTLINQNKALSEELASGMQFVYKLKEQADQLRELISLQMSGKYQLQEEDLYPRNQETLLHKNETEPLKSSEFRTVEEHKLQTELQKLEVVVITFKGEVRSLREVLSNLQQELEFQREENKRQRLVIFERGEEKREAIRQLCFTLDYLQERNKRLETIIVSTRDKIQRRISVSRRGGS